MLKVLSLCHKLDVLGPDGRTFNGLLACCCVQFGQVGVVVAEMPMEGEASPGAESEARRAERGAEPQFTSGAGAAEGLLVRSTPF